MTGNLITLPIRLYARGARLLLHTAEDVTGKALMGTLRVAGAIGNLRPGSGSEASTPTRPAPPTSQRPAPKPDPRSHATRSRGPAPTNGSGSATPTRPAEPEAPAPTPEAGNGASAPLASQRLEEEGLTTSIDLDAPTPAAPDHVSEEPVLVREEAEPGAEDGAGASIRVDEPWDGYRRMAARDIVTRLAASSPAELAGVQLYESTHRKRQTVLAAVAREFAKPGR